MKWYNVEIPYNTREAIRRAENFKVWLTDAFVKYEVSAVGDFLHFEIFTDERHARVINKVLDNLVFKDAIVEV